MKINKKETIKKLDKIMSQNAVAVAEMVLDRIEDFEDKDNELFEKIVGAVDDELIYTEDQWKIVANYIRPEEIGNTSFCDIVNGFVEDIFDSCVVEYQK